MAGPCIRGLHQRGHMKRLLIGIIIWIAGCLLSVSVQAKKVIGLQEAINLALERNRQLLDARDSLTSARYSLQSAQADFKIEISPSTKVGFSGSSGRSTVEDLGLGLNFYKKLPWGTELSLTPNISRTDSQYGSSVEVGLAQPLLKGLGRKQAMSGVYSAQFGLRSSMRSLQLSEINTILSTVRAVYDCIKQKEELRQNMASYDRLKSHRESLLAKARSGYGPAIDMYRVELELAQAENAVVQSQEALGDAYDSLKVLLDLPLDQEIDVKAPLEFSKISLSLSKALNIAFNHRIEIIQAFDEIKEARRLSEVAENDTWPQLNLVVKYGRLGYGTALGSSFGLDDHYWTVSLISNTDFFRRREKLAYQQSLLNVRRAIRRYSLIKDGVTREVKNSVRMLRKAWRQIELRKNSIDNAKGKLELAKVKFRWGKASNFDLIEAEKELRQAQTDFIKAVTDYIVGTYEFRRAIGTLMDDSGYDEKLNNWH